MATQRYLTASKYIAVCIEIPRLYRDMFSQMHLTIIFLSLVACVVGSASHSPGQRTKAPGQRGIIMPLTRNLNRKAQPQGKNGQLYGNVSIVNSHE